MKLIVSDYDDTFYTNNNDIKKNVKAVEQLMKTNLFAIATGRSYHDFLDVKNLYHIDYNYLIINHGATIIKNNQVLYNQPIDDTIKNNLLKDLQLEKTTFHLACSELNSRVSLTSNKITKINVRYPVQEIASHIKDIIMQKYGNYINCYFVCQNQAIEIVHKSVTKANAIRFIALHDHLSVTDIYTIGDSYSDIDMLNQFQGFAMEHAISEIKELGFKEYQSVASLIYDVINNKYEQNK